MFKIITNKKLTDTTYCLKVEAPYIAQHHKAGQFVILVNNEESERIPLTIADTDKNKGLITIYYQTIGKTTQDISKKNAGDYIDHIAGPLGKPTPIKKDGTIVCIGGGIGVATILPIAKAFKQIGNKVITITGARTHKLLLLKDELSATSDEIHLSTDDGSFGHKGFVTDILEKIISTNSVNKVISVGPIPMMKAVCAITKKNSIKTIVSLNSIMVDGTGMCGGCRINVNNQRKFTCIDGPEFDGHAIDYDELLNRLNTYSEMENESKNDHICKLESQINE